MKYKKLFTDAVANTFSSYLVLPFTMVSALLVRRIIGPYLTGIIATLSLFISYSTFSNLGILNAGERELPNCKGSGEAERFEHIKNSVFTVTLITGFLFSILMITWALLYRSTFDRYFFVGILVYAVCVFWQQWVFYYITLLRTSQSFIFLGKNTIIVGLLSSVGNLIAVWLFGFYGLLSMGLIVILFQVYYMIRYVGHIPSLRIDWVEIKKLVLIGLPLLIMGLAMTGIRTMDNILVIKLLGTEALGLYTIALLANNMIFQITNAMSGIFYPRMQISYGQNRMCENLSAYVIRPTLIMGLLLPFAIGAIFIITPTVVQYMLPLFQRGLTVFKIITVMTYFFAMFQMASCFLTTINKQFKMSIIFFLTIIITATLALLFNKFNLGLIGVALATGIGYIFCFLSINIYALRHWASWGKTFEFLWDLTIPFLYSTFLLVLIDMYTIPTRGWNVPILVFAIFIKMIFFGVAYLPLVWFFEGKTKLILDFINPVFIMVKARVKTSFLKI